MDREPSPRRLRSPREYHDIVTEIYEMLKNNTQKIDELCQEKNQSPRVKLESRTDAVIQNTQLLIKKTEESEKNIGNLSKRISNLNERLEEVELTMCDMPSFERSLLELRKEVAMMRRDFLILETAAVTSAPSE